MRIICPLVICLLLLTSSCGFHLRGTNGHELTLDKVHVSAANTYGEMQREVEHLITQSGVTLVEASQAAYTLTLTSENTTRRPVSTTSQNSVAEIELRLEVGIEVVGADDASIVPLTYLAAERIYRFDSSSLVGSNKEEELLLAEMRRDIASQILRRVDASVRARLKERDEDPT